jgi:hypothetical protein
MAQGLRNAHMDDNWSACSPALRSVQTCRLQALLCRNADATIQFQRDVIARLQFQLSSAQTKLGMTPQAIADAGTAAAQAVAGGDVAPWVLDPDVMTPLFAAYDTRIQVLLASL